MEPDEENIPWEDKTYSLLTYRLQHILKGRYYMGMKKYISDRPVTDNTFLTFLQLAAENGTMCDQYANVEQTFESVRKQNPIECYTGRTYNATRNMESLNDLVNVLAPYGNNTRRNMPGSCVFVMFYTVNCISSRLVWMEFFNAHNFFPNVQWVLVDSLKFYTLNADFGITGLPTLMLFHQGKPVRKYNLGRPTAMRLIKFLWQNTNLEPAETLHFTDDDFYFPQPKDEPDPYLKLAWAFILISVLYKTCHTAAFHTFLAFVKRVWHEKGAPGQHEHVE